jgi:hypothetical protein
MSLSGRRAADCGHTGYVPIEIDNDRVFNDQSRAAIVTFVRATDASERLTNQQESSAKTQRRGGFQRASALSCTAFAIGFLSLALGVKRAFDMPRNAA